jgi:hypothetical protein
MTDQMFQALMALAQKLGTTAEYLFGVLVKQAVISGITNAAILVVWLFVFRKWFSIVSAKTKRPPASKNDDYRGPRAEWDPEDTRYVFAWVSIAIMSVATFIMCVTIIPDVVTAILNPEYFALKQILK